MTAHPKTTGENTDAHSTVDSGAVLSGAIRAQLVLRALKSGISSASTELARLHKRGEAGNPETPLDFDRIIRTLLAEFSASINGIGGRSGKKDALAQSATSPLASKANVSNSRLRPFKSPTPLSDTSNRSATELARLLELEHASVAALTLCGQKTAYISDVLKAMQPSTAQRVVLVISRLENGTQNVNGELRQLVKAGAFNAR